jgi:hypothetical protein
MSEEQTPRLRVYTPWQVSVSCLIGGPPAASWLIAENFRIFDDRKKRMLTFIFGTLTLLALIGLGFALPKNSSGGVLAAVVAGMARDITKRQQGSLIENFQTKGGKIASWWSAVGIGFASLIALLVLILSIAFIAP